MYFQSNHSVFSRHLNHVCVKIRSARLGFLTTTPSLASPNFAMSSNRSVFSFASMIEVRMFTGSHGFSTGSPLKRLNGRKR